MNTHILLIEPNIHLTRLVESDLLNGSECDTGSVQSSQRHYCLSIARSGMEGLRHVRQSPPDLILLDMTLPDCSGVEMCRWLRSNGIQVPLILISTGHEIRDCLAGLDAGADDYVLHPFDMEELRARMRSRLRRTTLEVKPNRLQFEELTLDRLTREVYRNRYGIELTVKEFALLEYFMTHPRQVMTRDQILYQVWHDNLDIASNILDVYVRHLRLKLEQHQMSRLIHTVRGVGYVLREPPVRQVSPMKLVNSKTHSQFSAAI